MYKNEQERICKDHHTETLSPVCVCLRMSVYVHVCCSVCVYAWAFTHIAARRQVETQMDIEKNDKDSENDKLEFREIGGTQR